MSGSDPTLEEEIGYYLDTFPPTTRPGVLRHPGVDRLRRHREDQRLVLQRHGTSDPESIRRIGKISAIHETHPAYPHLPPFALAASADEGMWLPSLISEAHRRHARKGFRLTAEDIYSINKASMKDAVVLFDGGCTGELISAEGLLLTNHHCGYDAIQSHSSVEHDYLTQRILGHVARPELPNEKL